MTNTVTLKALIQESKDGEWGKGEPFNDSVEMAVIRGTDFESVRLGQLDDLPIRHIPKHIAARKVLRPNDILIETAGGSSERPTGRTVFIKPDLLHETERPLTCASFSRFIRIDPEKASPEYVFWLLQHLYSSGQMWQYSTRHTGVARFQYTTFAETERLALPEIDTQFRIAAILSAYDDLIANNTRRIKILEEMAQMLYRQWFVHFRFPGHEHVRMVDSPLGPVPEGWEIRRLGQIAEVNARNIRKGDEPQEIFYVDIASVSIGRIEKIEPMLFSEAPGRARRVVRHGDIIWSAVRPNRKSYSLILDPKPNTVVSTGFAVLSPCTVPYTYLYLATTTDDFVGYLTNHATGAAYPAVTGSTFEESQVVVPTGGLLEAFHNIASPLYTQIQVLQAENGNLRRTRELLLPELISGKTRITS